MKKNIIVIIIAIIMGILMGITLYKIDKKNNKIALLENAILTQEKTVDENKKNEINVSTSEVKITPNTEIEEEVCYKVCNHILTTKVDNKSFINMSEEEFEKANENCSIKEFTEENVVYYKEVDDFCNEHYLLKDIDGYLNIYTLGSDGNETGLDKTTEIATKYLSQKDREDLLEGIKVYSKQDLNKLIEDFE